MTGPIRYKVKRLIWTIALAAVTSACASTGFVPRPFPIPGAPSSPASAPEESTAPAVPARAPGGLDGYAVAGTALALRGTPYRNGGSDPNGFDCSGFTQYVFSRYGIPLPREVRDQYRTGRSVDPSDLAPGDLVFFATTDPNVSHVAIAIGGAQFIHAPTSSGVVRVEYMNGSYWASRFVGARRVAN